jgi:alkenylglycerophosphocholine/alkenylglycerophosphoethanolamine hydrolase
VNAASTIFTAVAIGCMLIDWWSVATQRASIEAVAKPAVMVALIGVALVGDTDPTSIRPWIVAGLAFGLLGDIALLPRIDRFIVGLAAFLVGHLAYVVAFVLIWSPSAWLVAGAAGLAVLVIRVGRPIERSLRTSSLHLPVVAYIAVSGAVVMTGAGTGRALIVLGTLAFAASDGLLGADRFLEPARDRRVWVHVLYQLGQAGIVVGAIAA